MDNWWTTFPRNTVQEPKKKKKKKTGRVEGIADRLVQVYFLSSFSLY